MEIRFCGKKKRFLAVSRTDQSPNLLYIPVNLTKTLKYLTETHFSCFKNFRKLQKIMKK